MTKKLRKEIDQESEIEAVLAGRRANARTLIDLIHSVNPTDRGFSPAEQERRYSLKSRLQSVLLRRHRDALAVLPDAAPGIALLRHRFLNTDACHVRLDALDDDARSWAQLQLDLGENDAPQPAPAAELEAPAPDTDPLARARAALADYDYEAAHALLAEVVREREGRGAASLLLLELLVDTLAFDAEALEVERILAPETAALPEVRLLLAIAAARLSRRSRAEELVRGLGSSRVAEVYALLASGALRAGEVQEAEALLEKAEDHALGQPQVAGIRAEIACRREEQLRPLSQGLVRCFEAGDLSGAERLARALLEQRPEHDFASRVLREVETRRRAEQARALLDDCERALAAEEPSLAASLLAQAARLGAEPGELPERIAALEATARERARRARVEEVLGLLSGSKRKPGLRAWLELDGASRGEVLERSGLVLLRWLEELGAPGSPARAGPLIDTVLWLAAARRAPADDRPDLLETRLLAHEKLLRELRPYRLFLAAVHERVLEKQRMEAARLVAQCQKAFGDGRREHAQALFERLEVAPGAAAVAAEIESLRAQASRLAELQLLASRASRKEGGAALLDARQAAEKLAQKEEGPARERWAARVEELTARIQREFRVRVDEVDAGLEIADLGRSMAIVGDAGQWLDETGRTALLLSAFERWLFVREIDVVAGRVRRQVSLRLPERPGVVNWQIEGSTLWVSLQSGWLLELSWKSWRVLGWYRITPDALARADAVVVAPGTRTVWAAQAGMRALDLEGPQSTRLVKERFVIEPTVAWTGAGVAALGTAHGCLLFAPHGAPIASPLADDSHGVLAVSVHPCGEGFAAMVTDPLGPKRDVYQGLCLLEVPDQGEARLHPVPDFKSAYAPYLCTSLEARCCFAVLAYPTLPAKELVAWGWREGSLRELYRVDAPVDLSLMVDCGSRRVVARYSRFGEQRLVPLTDQRPSFAMGGSHQWTLPPSNGPRPCSIAGRAKESGKLEALYPELRKMPARLRRRRVQQLAEQLRGSPEKLVELICLLEEIGEIRLAASVASKANGDHPSDPAVAVCYAEFLSALKESKRMLEVLGQAKDPCRIGDGAVHYYHLLGVGRLRTGDTAGALAAWREGEKLGKDACCLYEEILINEPQSEPLPEQQWGRNAWTLVQFKNALLAADQRLAAGDPLGAARALERDVILTEVEAQCLGRLAAAWLAVEPDGPEARFRKMAALAAAVESCDPDGLLHKSDMGLPNRWNQARLEELAARAAAWLEEHG